jgi:hypothetical protein
MKSLSKTITLTLLLLTSLSLSAQNWWGWSNGVQGKGPIVRKTLDISSFEGFSLTFSGNVYVRQGSEQKVEVESHENLIGLLSKQVEDKYWKIRFTENVGRYDKFNVYITVPTLNAVRLSGSGDIKGETAFKNLGKLALGISGSGNLNFDFEATEVEARISGSGDMNLKGNAKSINLGISGSGDISALDVQVEAAMIQISGSGDASIHSTENLEVRISGSGDVYYKGRPRMSSKVSGSGDVVSRE